MSVEKIISEQEQLRKTTLGRRWFGVLVVVNALLVGYLIFQFIYLAL